MRQVREREYDESLFLKRVNYIVKARDLDGRKRFDDIGDLSYPIAGIGFFKPNHDKNRFGIEYLINPEIITPERYPVMKIICYRGLIDVSARISTDGIPLKAIFQKGYFWEVFNPPSKTYYVYDPIFKVYGTNPNAHAIINNTVKTYPLSVLELENLIPLCDKGGRK